MSRTLYPIPDWPALRVACVILSSVRPGKSRFERPLPDLVVDLRSTLPMQDCVAVNLEDKVDVEHQITASDLNTFTIVSHQHANEVCHDYNMKSGDELISLKETFGLCERRAEQHYNISVRAT